MIDLFNKQQKKRPFVLIILDGWGIAPVWGGNAISIAETRNFDRAFSSYPHTILNASGEPVGLPPGSPGNSEAGHLNIGAGYVVHQDGAIIDDKINDGSYFSNQTIIEAIDHAKKNNSTLHLMGLLSKTGTHSQLRHLYALLDLIKSQNFSRVCIHFFTDGRDSDPMSGIEMANEVAEKIAAVGIGKMCSFVGRFFAMDRDNRWERIEKAYNLLVNGTGEQFTNWRSVFSSTYTKGKTDEFIEPSIVANKEQSFEPIKDNDSVIFFNFRSDRARELTKAFLASDFPGFANRRFLSNLYFCSFVMNDEIQLSKPVFVLEKIANPLAGLWSNANLTQFHIAETEKYAHITYFLNGGQESPFPGESRMMIPSPKEYPTYDLIPQMNIQLVTGNIVEQLQKNAYDCYAINFANADMVGHTGNLKAAVQAVEFVDRALGSILNEVLNQDGVAYITADHGNAEQMVNPKTGEPDTEHTLNPVPFMVISNEKDLQKLRFKAGGSLSSITPTILDTMNISYENKNESLVIKQ